MLDSRKGAILRAIVREYVRAGQAVGSKALTETIGLGVSAATVRNDMALLEELGYISRPHSSAGGVPTDLGYRWFIDNWPGPAWPELPPGQQRVIEDAFQSGFHALEEALNATSQLLSEVTESVAVVAAPPARENRLRRLELLARSDGRVGLLLIADTGLVEQGLIDVPEPLSDQQLADLGAHLTARLSGEALEVVPARLAAIAEHTGPTGVVPRIAAEVGRVVSGSVWERIYRGGTANILSREKFSDLETAHGVVGAIERPPVLATLMAEARESRPGSGTLVVLIGQENPIQQMQVCATILAPYGSNVPGEGPAHRGMVAVIGPTRMDYPYTISAVNLVVRSLSGLLDELAS
ncbi:MAG TPA: heat-inducible transcriptional repressor HrcA [Actinomycetota bacterium]|nr:heat-inducible transcriptional repressor HrcA [Actinomycetota bacterium]